MAPKDEQELRDMLYSAVFSYTSGPVAIRYPRGNGFGVPIKPMSFLPLGKGEIVKSGSDIAIIALGTMVQQALKASEELEKYDISLEVINPRFIKPLDSELLLNLFSRFKHIITIEDSQKTGGFGTAVLEFAAENDIKDTVFHILGIPDKFIHHGTQEQLYRELELDSDGIVKKVLSIIPSYEKSNF